MLYSVEIYSINWLLRVMSRSVRQTLACHSMLSMYTIPYLYVGTWQNKNLSVIAGVDPGSL